MSDEEKPDKPQSPATTEEITRKLEDFIKNSLGGQVLFTKVGTGQSHGSGAAPQEDDEDREADDGIETFEFRFKPADIKSYLDRFVIRQDEAKKVLATAVCDHYHHARMLREHRSQGGSGPELEFSKQNVIIIGPTGVGKTYLVKHIADLIGVPFVKADATKFSETGYVGGDVDDLVRDLVAKANGNLELAEHGIIYLDEIDKLATFGDRMGRDVSGRGVQTALLKLMEETEVPLYAPNDIRSQMQMMFDTRKGRTGREVINTRNILFIVSGAFSGLEKIIQKRLSRGTIGFGAPGAQELSSEALQREATTQDFIDHGFEAEFIGRLPVRVVCDPLSAEDLFQIMKCSEGSLIRQYEREFAAYSIRARFEDDALRLVAERAAKEKTGARGLVTAWERVLREFKFELPSLNLPELVVDAGLVQSPQVAIEQCREAARSLEGDPRVGEVQAFAAAFRHEHGLELQFSLAAIKALVARAGREGSGVPELCKRLFKDFPFGLQLVARNSGQLAFPVEEEAIASPDKYLSDLVARSYRDAAPAQASADSHFPSTTPSDHGA